ncbi:hypothetical protein [Salinivibrio sharmensis]|uniref:Uncharacterized protein n=1 Tax=Salinivibrio sharmensis TaxID=390883 RepID=A0ABX3KE75_9GAMM|nr:hypothetical protein [Salinivibrio sharmensis]OOE87026.1 hypothetical protein BZG74_11745 [Salinivibrio sharmensis]
MVKFSECLISSVQKLSESSAIFLLRIIVAISSAILTPLIIATKTLLLKPLPEEHVSYVIFMLGVLGFFLGLLLFKGFHTLISVCIVKTSNIKTSLVEPPSKEDKKSEKIEHYLNVKDTLSEREKEILMAASLMDIQLNSLALDGAIKTLIERGFLFEITNSQSNHYIMRIDESIKDTVHEEAVCLYSEKVDYLRMRHGDTLNDLVELFNKNNHGEIYPKHPLRPALMNSAITMATTELCDIENTMENNEQVLNACLDQRFKAILEKESGVELKREVKVPFPMFNG